MYYSRKESPSLMTLTHLQVSLHCDAVLKPREMCAWSTPRCGCYVVVCLFTLVISDPVKIEPVTYVGKKSLQTHSGKKLPFSCLCD